MNKSWAAPGVECVCVNDQGWFKLVLGGLFGIQIDGPGFMQQCVIDRLDYNANENENHRVKLWIKGYTETYYCACKFEPLQKIEDEHEQEVTAPVTPELERV